MGFFDAIVFGFCFLIIAFARYFGSIWLFILAVLVGVFGVVFHGEFYTRLVKDTLKDEKRGLIAWIYKNGLLITIVSLLIAAYIMDRFEEIIVNLSIFGRNISVSFVGYLIVFEMAAVCFILSGYILSKRGQQTRLHFQTRNTPRKNYAVGQSTAQCRGSA